MEVLIHQQQQHDEDASGGGKCTENVTDVLDSRHNRTDDNCNNDSSAFVGCSTPANDVVAPGNTRTVSAGACIASGYGAVGNDHTVKSSTADNRMQIVGVLGGPVGEKSALLSGKERVGDCLVSVVAKEDETPPNISLWEEYAGFIILLISSLFLAAAALFVKMASESGLNSLQITGGRWIVHLILSSFSSKCVSKVAIMGPRELRPVLFLRGTLGSASTILLYSSISLMDLGDATAIFYTSPFFATLIAYIWLGEGTSWLSTTASILSFLGVVLIASPKWFMFGGGEEVAKNVSSWGPVVAVVGAITSGFSMTSIRRVGSGCSPVTMSFYLGYTGFLLYVPAAIMFTTNEEVALIKQNPQILLYVVAVGSLAFVSQTMLNAGIQRERIGAAGYIRNINIVWAYCNQVIWLGKEVQVSCLIGATIIVFSSALAVVSKVFERRNRLARK